MPFPIMPPFLIVLIYFVFHWKSVSSLPTLSPMTQKADDEASHNELPCHNSSSVAHASEQKDPEFLSTTTFGVFSVLLAFASLVVAVVGVIQYRKCRNNLNQVNNPASFALQTIGAPQGAIPPPLPIPSLPPPHLTHHGDPSAVGASTAVCVAPLTGSQQPAASGVPGTNSSETLVAVGLSPPPSKKKATRPQRPPLSPLRLRSSLLQVQTLRMAACSRTTTM
ncbi:hypothetical protein BU24DRAFT_451852 [Aaosphaeria arxii CBS 175.79]|uniref:Uncharacterized protein n=1 Tax=Aaosphaeria arxii CBS 175.79 TaxID=1450172 RepID=A0A6A5XQ91_9PLEO|nr:uncharacterized protein BU24DRAFT_451852 [Aaosphaeria arxii CBS 175.79]KAF2014931.1 hypothetical protein BU24DRAFT_451852 [Aaosphaeria arxii CBS 175.79]